MNETYFSVLQSILRDRYGDEILSANEEVINGTEISDNNSNIFNSTVYTWILATLCSALVGLSGLLPVFFTPECAIQNEDKIEESGVKRNDSCNTCETDNKVQCSQLRIRKNSNNNLDHFLPPQQNISEPKQKNNKLKLMLSFAVGGLLGDVFLHLLPEAHHKLYVKAATAQDPFKYIHDGHMTIGLWILFGILTFIFVEMIFNINKNNEENTKEINKEIETKENIKGPDADDNNIKNHVIGKSDKGEPSDGSISVTGYLNLIANCVDNFSHGLAVGGAFLISPKVGITTTLCILVHEIPHEIGDFAILIKSGFNRYDAAIAQLSTASIGIGGAIIALALDTFLNVFLDIF